MFNLLTCTILGGPSLAKVIIAMEDGVIPKNLHFNNPNEHISGIKEGKLKVVEENTPWLGGLIGVSSFGFGGANAHAILKSNDKSKSTHEECEKPRLFVYGSRTKEAVEHVLKMAQQFPSDMDLHALWNESSNMSTETHPYRGFTVLNSSQNIFDIQVC